MLRSLSTVRRCLRKLLDEAVLLGRQYGGWSMQLLPRRCE